MLPFISSLICKDEFKWLFKDSKSLEIYFINFEKII